MVADLILGVLLGLGIFFGYKKGMLVELITLLAFVIALVSAFKLLNSALELLKPHVHSGSFAILISFIIVFTAVFVLIFLLGKLLKRTIDYTFLGTFDNIAGCLLGGLKAAFSASMILWLCHHAGIDAAYKEYTKGAILYPYMVSFGPEFIGWISYVIPFRDIFPSIRELLN